jgi:4-hydroxy-4-methyl-2-oxoglutarate aldolase
MSSIPAISAEAVAFYRTASSSLVTDAMFRFGIGAWIDDVHPVDPAWRIAGRVRTVTMAAKSGLKHPPQSFYTVAEALEPGDIMLVGTDGGRGWLIGENIAHFLLGKGLAGFVTDGRIRDTLELRDLGFPVFARRSSARPFGFEIEIVEVDAPIRCGGAYVRSGDLLVGDADGIVVVPHEAVERLVEETAELMVLEKEQEIAIASGASAAEIQKISQRKKTVKGAPFDPVARKG